MKISIFGLTCLLAALLVPGAAFATGRFAIIERANSVINSGDVITSGYDLTIESYHPGADGNPLVPSNQGGNVRTQVKAGTQMRALDFYTICEGDPDRGEFLSTRYMEVRVLETNTTGWMIQDESYLDRCSDRMENGELRSFDDSL